MEKNLHLRDKFFSFQEKSGIFVEKADIYSIFTVFRYADGDMSVALLKAREK